MPAAEVFPELNAAFVARVEYYGAILLILGLFTRFAALGLLSTMAVALGAGGGNFNVTARGTSGSLSHSATSVLDAQDF